MATILKAGNVATGAQISSDSTGILEVRTGTGAGTTAITIGTNQNVNFSGTAQRITGDFSNATVANRVMFQTSTTNGVTNVAAIPNGTGVVGSFSAFNNSNPTNAAFVSIGTTGGTEARIQSGATGTGTFLPITFFTGGSERMRVDTSGNVGIGTSSPTYRLDVGGTVAGDVSAGVYNRDTASASQATIVARKNNDILRMTTLFGVGVFGSFNNIPILFETNATERMRIDTSGNVGIGTSSPADAQLTTAVAVNAASGYCGFRVLSNGTAVGRVVGSVGEFRVDSLSTNPLTLYTNGNERARIDSSGNFLVGTTGTIVTNYQSRFGVMATTFNGNQGFIGIGATITTSIDLMQFINPNGLVGRISTSGSATSYVTSSDYRLKEEIAPMTGALAKVAALKPCTYKWKADGSDGEGFIAHELAEVCPQAVTGAKDAVNEDGSIKAQGIDTSFLVATLTAAIQELNAKVEAQAAEIAALKGAA